MLYRMELCNDDEGYTLPCSVEIRRYCAKRDHEAIRSVYGRSFGEPPWPLDWDRFDEFDANGAFIAEDVGTAEVIGYVLSFRRRDYGYISVVAVVPEYHRQGVGFALVGTAIRYLRGLSLRTIRIDVYVDATPAVNLYRKVGFRVETTFEDEEDE
ncbi:MAG: GNAT family N-acetyltransferase [Dehalococcoidia bacterium]